MIVTQRFSRERPVSMAQGRNGELIVVQGNGIRPARWNGDGEAVDAGMNAPTAAPTVALQGGPLYYVARVDITKPGACYYAPPVVTFASDGSSARQAKAASYLNQASVGEIRVLDGGKGYTTQPSVELSDTHGKGAVIEAVLDGDGSSPPEDPTDDPKTGLTDWDIVENGGSNAQFAGIGGVNGRFFYYDLPINGNGTFEVPLYYYVRNADRTQIFCFSSRTGFTDKLRYTVSGMSSGSGAILRIRWFGGAFISACVQFGREENFYEGAARLDTAERQRYGAGYSDNDTVRVTINPIRGDSSKKVVIEGMTRGNENNAASPRYRVKELVLKNGGSGYLVAPQIKITSDSGFGAYATCKVKNGRITEVTLENSGGGYKTAPTVEVVSGGAEAFAVARPHLRGTYQCYYRYVDNTPESKGGPIPSNLSPLKEVDAGEGMASASWTVAAPSGRAAKAELWRSTSNQATTLYRVASISGTTFSDSLTDDELRDPDREGYAAMPIVLPNGELNANRFGIPPSDKSSVVRFQDRFWYGVDTGEDEPNHIYYSEVDEPESVPDSNEIILQQNARDADRLRALIPFGSTLLLMQERHAFSLTFAKTPILDAQVDPIAYRGCLNQRSWDIYDGVCYVLDQYGIYAITPTGQVENLSAPIDNMFRTDIDFSKSTWAFMLVEAKTKTLRAFVAFKEDSSSGHPSRVLCYSLDTKAWWVEKYPQRVSGGAQVRMSNGDFRCIYAAQSGPVLLNEGFSDLARGSVVSVSLTNGGTGYRTPPAVTATGGCGATFQASINNEGNVTAIWITSPGFGYQNGSLVIGPPNDPNAENAVQATAAFTATPLSVDIPLYPTYRFKGGSAPYATESNDPKAATDTQRTITLHYEPQQKTCEVSLRTYYNNAASPRPNVALRTRGVGFSHSLVDNAARYDLAALTGTTGSDSGIASALFAGRTLADIQSSDKYISVELVGARKSTHPLTFYGLDIAGVAGK